MQIFKSKHNGLDFCQIYATKDELQNEEIQEKIERLQKEQKNSELKRTSESKGAELILDIINNCLNKNNINHHDTNTKKLSINDNSITININLISIIKKNIDTYTS